MTFTPLSEPAQYHLPATFWFFIHLIFPLFRFSKSISWPWNYRNSRPNQRQVEFATLNLNSAYDNTSLFCCIILGNIALLIAPKPESSVFGALGLAIKTLGLHNMLFTLRNCPGLCLQVFFNQLTETIVAYWALCQLVWHMVKELSMYRDVANKGEFISRMPRKTFTTVRPYLGELTIQI